MADIKLNSANGSMTIKAEDGTGNVDFVLPRGGFLTPTGDGSQLSGITSSQFTEYNTALQITLSGQGATYTWSPSLPANTWVAADVFLSSTDGDQSDHFNVHIGHTSSTANSWGDTYPAALPPYGVAIVTNLGDSQGVAAGHYGAWNHTTFKTNSSGQVIFTIAGTNAGSGVYVRVKGYWAN